MWVAEPSVDTSIFGVGLFRAPSEGDGDEPEDAHGREPDTSAQNEHRSCTAH